MNRRTYLVVAALGTCWLSGCASMTAPAQLSQSAMAHRHPDPQYDHRVALGLPRPQRASGTIASTRPAVIQQASAQLPSLAPPATVVHGEQLPMPQGSQPPATGVGPAPVYAAPPDGHVVGGPGMPGWAMPSSGWNWPMGRLHDWLACHGLNLNKHGLSLGIDAYFVKPHWTDNPAYLTQFINNLTTESSTALQITDFDYDYKVTPRLWIAYECGDGLGVRSRLWRFEDSVDVALIDQAGSTGDAVDQFFITAGPFPIDTDLGDVLAIRNRLKLDVIDVEGFQTFRLGCWSLNGAAGVRYAQLRQSYKATRLGALPGVSDDLTASNNFRGFGPTLAAEARRAIGCRGFGVYGGIRGALLYGDVDQSGTLVSNTAPDGIPFVASSTFDRSHQELLPVGEVELGLEWTHDSCRGRWVFQVGYAGQVWFDAGDASFFRSGNLAFSGWTASVGVYW